LPKILSKLVQIRPKLGQNGWKFGKVRSKLGQIGWL